MIIRSFAYLVTCLHRSLFYVLSCYYTEERKYSFSCCDGNLRLTFVDMRPNEKLNHINNYSISKSDDLQLILVNK